MSDEGKQSWQPGHKPSVRDALVLLGASAVCSALFYLWLGDIVASLGYGVLLGCGLAAIGAEFYKFIGAYRAEHPAGGATAAVRSLVGQAFRIGFVTTFVMVLKELFKLLGIKILVSIVIALTALYVAGKSHWF